MITRFFSAVRSAILAIPGNPYGTIAALRVSLNESRNDVFLYSIRNRSLRGDVHAVRTAKNALQKSFDVALKNWTTLLDAREAEIEALEMANEDFMRERDVLKKTVRAHVAVGLMLTKVAMEQDAALQAQAADLGDFSEANLALAETVAELQAERDGTLPFLQAVEAKLASIGITVADVDGEPAVTVNSTLVAEAIRTRSVTLATSPAPVAA